MPIFRYFPRAFFMNSHPVLTFLLCYIKIIGFIIFITHYVVEQIIYNDKFRVIIL